MKPDPQSTISNRQGATKRRRNPAMLFWTGYALLVLLALAATARAFASTVGEQVRCTSQPRAAWLSEARIKAIFGADKYAAVKFKVSRTNCYEFYAVTHEGDIVEAYYDPIDGRLVRENRMTAPAAPAARRTAG